MISRLLYHSFWNIYDHLGGLALVGLLHVVTACLAAALAILLPSVSTALLYISGIFVATALAMAALLPYCARAARGQPARLRHLLPGMKSSWIRVLILSLTLAVLLGICYLNFRVYLGMQTATGSRPGQLITMLMAGLQGWMFLLVAVICWPLICSSTADSDKLPLRQAARRAVVSVTLCPGLWIFVSIMLLGTLIIAAWSHFGILLYLPLATMTAQTAWFLSQQYIDFLAAARSESASQPPLRQLKSRARELATDWEYAQPRRTAKELIRPWEY